MHQAGNYYSFCILQLVSHLEKDIDDAVEKLLKILDQKYEKSVDWSDLTVYTGTTGMHCIKSMPKILGTFE